MVIKNAQQVKTMS